MQRTYSFVLFMVFFLISCQPQSILTITIIDGEQIHRSTTIEQVPAALLKQVGINLLANDAVLLNGQPIDPNQPISNNQSYTFQVRHPIALTVNGKLIQTNADTIGMALAQAGMQLYASDQITPPISTPISGPMKVTNIPSHALTVMQDGRPLPIRSSAATVGAVLAEAAIPLFGLDFSQPPEEEVYPSVGQIQVTRSSESILLSEKSIPYKTDYQDSANVELDQQQVIQVGQPGLSVSRVRIIYQNGQEVSRHAEPEVVVRAPQDQILAYGTKVVIHSTAIDGVQIQYWRAMPMYATAYSPCNSSMTGCASGTAIGLPAGKGVVAVDPSMYNLLAGQHVYVPGYGSAIVGDVGGGYIIEQKLGISRSHWIDLGYSDSECKTACDQWSKWITVYFLAPAPVNIPLPN